MNAQYYNYISGERTLIGGPADRWVVLQYRHVFNQVPPLPSNREMIRQLYNEPFFQSFSESELQRQEKEFCSLPTFYYLQVLRCGRSQLEPGDFYGLALILTILVYDLNCGTISDRQYMLGYKHFFRTHENTFFFDAEFRHRFYDDPVFNIELGTRLQPIGREEEEE